MGFIEDAALTAKDAAEVVKKKAEGIYSSSKKKFSLAEQKRKLEDKYCELGKTVYSNIKEDSEDKVATELLVEEIDLLVQEINLAQESINKNSNLITCPSCSFANIREANYCAKCGEKLA